MPVIHKKGNLLNSDCDYICHQVNCQGKMNSGIAKSIREKWPHVYNNYFSKWCQNMYAERPNSNLLGDIQIIDLYEYNVSPEFKQYVINMFAQDGYGYDGLRYTSYDAFWTCLYQIKRTIPKGKKIGFPYNIGCCRGGGNWDLIYWMIDYILGKDYNVEIWQLEEEENETEDS